MQRPGDYQSGQVTFLINYTNKSSPPVANRRLSNYLKRESLRGFTSVERVAKCGVTRFSQVTIQRYKGRAFFKGLITCGSVHLCPPCSDKILTRRATEARKAAQSWFDRGGYLYSATFTLPNAKGLQNLFKVSREAWSAVVAGKAWQADKEKLGVLGYLLAQEVKFTAQQEWNHHFHILFFADRPVGPDELKEWHARLVSRWIRRALRSNVVVSPDAQSIDEVRHSQKDFIRALSYLFKDSAGSVQPLSSSLSMSELLSAAIANSHSWAREAWSEWERASKGKAKVRYSHGLKERLGIQEKPEKLVLEEGHLIEIEPEAIRLLVSLPMLQNRTLLAFEEGGWQEASWFLEQNGIAHSILVSGESK